MKKQVASIKKKDPIRRNYDWKITCDCGVSFTIPPQPTYAKPRDWLPQGWTSYPLDGKVWEQKLVCPNCSKKRDLNEFHR